MNNDEHGVLKGWPPTKEIEKGGERGYQITAAYLTPLRAKVLNSVVDVFMIFLRPLLRLVIIAAFFLFMAATLFGVHNGSDQDTCKK